MTKPKPHPLAGWVGFNPNLRTSFRIDFVIDGVAFVRPMTAGREAAYHIAIPLNGLQNTAGEDLLLFPGVEEFRAYYDRVLRVRIPA